jgi:hypothetical protein
MGSHGSTECPDKDSDPGTRPDSFDAQLQGARQSWNPKRYEGREHSTRRQKNALVAPLEPLETLEPLLESAAPCEDLGQLGQDEPASG